MRGANTRSNRQRAAQEMDVRYSEFLKLSYFDIIRCHLIDPMHNLLLGTSKRMLLIWKENGLLQNASFEEIQGKIDSIIPAANIGRIPSKISAGFAGFTAEQ